MCCALMEAHCKPRQSVGPMMRARIEPFSFIPQHRKNNYFLYSLVKLPRPISVKRWFSTQTAAAAFDQKSSNKHKGWSV